VPDKATSSPLSGTPPGPVCGGGVGADRDGYQVVGEKLGGRLMRLAAKVGAGSVEKPMGHTWSVGWQGPCERPADQMNGQLGRGYSRTEWEVGTQSGSGLLGRLRGRLLGVWMGARGWVCIRIPSALR
jgi:hypothetical protein